MAAGAVWILLGDGPSTAEGRIAAMSDAPQKDGAFSFLRKEDPAASRRKQIEDSLGDMEQAQKDRSRKRKTLKARLLQADWSTTPQTFIVYNVFVGLVMAGLVALFTPAPALVTVGAGVALGFFLPRMALNMAIGRRQKKFLRAFPDAMDIIVRGVRSGLPLNDCLKVIAHESPEPVASEFKLVVQGEQVGVPIETCLERMYERIPLPEINFFATVLNIQKTTGGNLGEALQNLSTVLRGRKILREKIKSLSAEAKASAVIVGALPIVVGVIATFANPEYMSDLYNTSTGQRNLMISAGMMVFGTFVMRKMINFKF